jgi:hypothetical protein
MLLYRRWREADEARLEAEGVLRERLMAASQAEAAARAAGKAREGRRMCCPVGARRRRLRRPSCSGWWCSATGWPSRRRGRGR